MNDPKTHSTSSLDVLYEDNHLIAVYKPAGVLVQEDVSKDESLMDQVKKYLKEKYQKPGNVFLGLVHRLDRPVSGVVLFAKTSKGASRVSEQFRERAVAKTYHAWVEGVPAEKKAKLQNFIVKDENMGKAFVYDEAEKGSLPAALSYEFVRKEEYNGKTFSCLKISLQTGRFHQIRAQLAHIGHPIAGDFKYGALRGLTDQSIKLCATSLEFMTATTDEKKIISIDPPPLLPLN